MSPRIWFKFGRNNSVEDGEVSINSQKTPQLSQSSQIDLVDDLPEKNRPIWKGNFNLYWLLTTILAVYFTGVIGIPFMFKEVISPMSIVHLVFVALVSWGCIWNLFHTPSHGPIYRIIHIWLGRASLFAGFIGLIAGFIRTWFPNGYEEPDLSFKIGITVGGSCMFVGQICGLFAIRIKKHVWAHAISMCGIYYAGCLMPAYMRLPEYLHIAEYVLPYWNWFIWVGGVTGWALGAWAIKRNSFF